MHHRSLLWLAILLFSYTANAQDTTGSSPPGNAWNNNPNGVLPSPPVAQAYPPATYPPAYPYPGQNAYPGQAGWQYGAYEGQKRSPGIALLLELFIPGVGSIYGDHLTGALVTWGLQILGFVLIFDSLNFDSSCNDYDSSYSSYCERDVNNGELLVGVGLLLGGRIYGFIDAYSSTNDYNLRLRRQLGLPEWISVGVSPIHNSREAVAYAPTLRLRF